MTFSRPPREGHLDRAAALAHLEQFQWLEECSLGDFQTELTGETLVVTYTITMRVRWEARPCRRPRSV